MSVKSVGRVLYWCDCCPSDSPRKIVLQVRLTMRRKGLRSQELPAARSSPQAGRKVLRPARRGAPHLCAGRRPRSKGNNHLRQDGPAHQSATQAMISLMPPPSLIHLTESLISKRITALSADEAGHETGTEASRTTYLFQAKNRHIKSVCS